MVEGLAVCDWAVGRARAGHGKQIPPSALGGKSYPWIGPGKMETAKGGFLSALDDSTTLDLTLEP